MFLGKGKSCSLRWCTKEDGSSVLPSTLLQLHLGGLLSLEPSSIFTALLQGSRSSMLFFFFFFGKCLSIYFQLSPLYALEGFQDFCFYIFDHVFHSHLGILDAGQLEGFLGCRETQMTLLGAILAKLKLETYTVTLLRFLSILFILP